jgi:hypothetical protein
MLEFLFCIKTEIQASERLSIKFIACIKTEIQALKLKFKR